MVGGLHPAHALLLSGVCHRPDRWGGGGPAEPSDGGPSTAGPARLALPRSESDRAQGRRAQGMGRGGRRGGRHREPSFLPQMRAQSCTERLLCRVSRPTGGGALQQDMPGRRGCVRRRGNSADLGSEEGPGARGKPLWPRPELAPTWPLRAGCRAGRRRWGCKLNDWSKLTPGPRTDLPPTGPS